MLLELQDILNLVAIAVFTAAMDTLNLKEELNLKKSKEETEADKNARTV